MAHYSRGDFAYVDFDFKRPDKRSPRLRPMWHVLRMLGLKPRQFCLERSRKGWHVIIKLSEKLLDGEKVALQYLLGSDRKREGLDLMRAISLRKKCYGVTSFWGKRWNILYSGKL